MTDALRLLSALDSADIDWLLGAGVEERIAPGTALITEGAHLDALWVALEGLLAVRIAALGPRELARLGPGEILGEISFLEGERASATITAVEPSLVLRLPRASLEVRIARDAAFGARFYRALARLNARRLRERVGSLGAMLAAAGDTDANGAEIERRLDGMKSLLARADREALANGDVVPAATEAEVLSEFRRFTDFLDERIGERATEVHPGVRAGLGKRVHRELLPYLLLTRTAERFYSKPRGYAGDFLTIAGIYDNVPGGTGRLGALVDRCFLETAASQAVRNRRALLTDEIADEIARRPPGEPARVTSLACGPAAEVFDAYARLSDPTRLLATGVDIDFQALAWVAERRDRARLRKLFALEQANLVYLAAGRQKLDLPPQHLVYSIGLVDYFEDGHVVAMLNLVHRMLAPGGRVLLGNFHPRNPTRAAMDHIVEWRLIHRTEADMDRLFEASAFGRPSTRVRFEPECVNLFAECVKAG